MGGRIGDGGIPGSTLPWSSRAIVRGCHAAVMGVLLPTEEKIARLHQGENCAFRTRLRKRKKE